MKKILCMDWGGTFMKYALMDEEGHMLSSSKVKSPKKTESKEALLSCLDKIVYSFDGIDGIAISSAGVIDSAIQFLFILIYISFNIGICSDICSCIHNFHSTLLIG